MNNNSAMMASTIRIVISIRSSSRKASLRTGSIIPAHLAAETSVPVPRSVPGRPLAAAVDDRGRAAPRRHRHPDQRYHQPDDADAHQDVTDDVPVDVGRVHRHREPQDRPHGDQHYGRSDSHFRLPLFDIVFLLRIIRTLQAVGANAASYRPGLAKPIVTTVPELPGSMRALAQSSCSSGSPIPIPRSERLRAGTLRAPMPSSTTTTTSRSADCLTLSVTGPGEPG